MTVRRSEKTVRTVNLEIEEDDRRTIVDSVFGLPWIPTRITWQPGAPTVTFDGARTDLTVQHWQGNQRARYDDLPQVYRDAFGSATFDAAPDDTEVDQAIADADALAAALLAVAKKHRGAPTRRRMPYWQSGLWRRTADDFADEVTATVRRFEGR